MAYKYGAGGGGVSTVESQKNKPKKKASPGVVTRVLDLLSRGQYASAGLAQGKGPKESLSMAWKGLQGKEKHSYAKVLSSRLGVKGKPAAVLGFVGDVALDPTTYVGVGLGKTAGQVAIKGGSAALGKGAAKKVVKGAAKDVLPSGARDVINRRIAAEIGGGAQKGGATLWTPGKGAQTAVRAGKTPRPVGGRSLSSALPGRPTGRALELKVLGKTVARSERGYNAAAKALSPIANTKTANLIGRTFKTGHGLPEHMRQVQRKTVGVSSQDYQKELRQIQDTFRPFKKSERQMMGAAVSRNELSSLPEHLQKPARWAQEKLDAIRPESGVLTGSQKLFADDDYFEPMVKQGKKSDLPSDAEDIADVLARQTDKHLTSRAHDDFVEEVTRRFGDDLKDPQVKEALERTKRVFTPNSKEAAEWTRKFDKIQGMWKMAVTAPNPGFHIRNLMGDTYLNYLDGVVDPTVYQKAIRTLKKGGGKDVKVKVGARVLTGADVMDLYQRHGLRSRFTQTENVVGGTSSKIVRKIGDASDFREDMSRLAHFMDALKKEAAGGKTLDDAAEAAAARVRKFNIDYGDVTDVEKKLKRAIPFYTFARKALPTQLEMTFTRPGRVVVLPKGKQMVERLVGARGDGDDQEPLPGIDEALPPWMRDKFTVSKGGNRVWQPDLPIDLLGEYANPVKGIANSITPALKLPVELTGGKMPFSYGKKSPSVARQLINTTPLGRQVGNVVEDRSSAGEKFKGYLGGPIATKVISGAPERKSKSKTSKSKGGKSTKSKGGAYKYGS